MKQKVDCKVVLTKHCIPWRDFVISNYKRFYKLNLVLKTNTWVPIVERSIRKEMMEYDSIDQIIVVTDFAKKSLNTLFKISNDKIKKIYYGFSALGNSIDRKYKKINLRNKYGYDNSEFIILASGNVSARKGVFDLISCFEKIQSINFNIKLRLIIAGSDEHSSIFKKCKKYWSKITITASLNKETLYDFYSIADLGIVPSFIEQCSYTAIEMMRAKLPILVSETDGLKEIVNNNIG